MQKNVIEYLSATVNRFPEKVAVKDSEMSITFSELWDIAQMISSALVNLNIGLNNPIGVYIPKGCKMIESFAGINMSGNNIKIPNHVAIILDGNGRWAKLRGKKRSEGHLAGFNNLEKLSEYIFSKGVKVLSVFAFSTENFKRSSEEVGYLMDLAIKVFLKEAKTFIDGKIKVMFSGSKENLRDDVLNAMTSIENSTKDFNDRVLNICFNYGSHEEIVNATKNICIDFANGKISLDDITDKMFEDNEMNNPAENIEEAANTDEVKVASNEQAEAEPVKADPQPAHWSNSGANQSPNYGYNQYSNVRPQMPPQFDNYSGGSNPYAAPVNNQYNANYQNGASFNFNNGEYSYRPPYSTYGSNSPMNNGNVYPNAANVQHKADLSNEVNKRAKKIKGRTFSMGAVALLIIGCVLLSFGAGFGGAYISMMLNGTDEIKKRYMSQLKYYKIALI